MVPSGTRRVGPAGRGSGRPSIDTPLVDTPLEDMPLIGTPLEDNEPSSIVWPAGGMTVRVPSGLTAMWST